MAEKTGQAQADKWNPGQIKTDRKNPKQKYSVLLYTNCFKTCSKCLLIIEKSSKFFIQTVSGTIGRFYPCDEEQLKINHLLQARLLKRKLVF